MRQHLSRAEWQQANPRVQEEILWWLSYRGYRQLNLGTCLELLKDVSYYLHQEESDGRFFNNIMMNHESVFGWDGDAAEPIATIWWDICDRLKDLLANGKTLKEKLTQ